MSGFSRRFLLVCLLFSCASALAAGPQLQVVKSKYYLIHTDLDDGLVLDLGRRLDAMYAEYSRRMSDFDLRADQKPLDVYLFKFKQDYADFTQNKYKNTGGVFLPGKNQLVAYLEGQRDTLRRTLQHEAFHQFAFKATGTNMPIWLNEGMAQLFEESIWTGETFLMNQVPPRRIRQLQSDIKLNKLLAMKTLMSLSPERWSANLGNDAAAGSIQYNQSWAMVHYMAYGEDGQNGVKLVSLLRALGKGQNAEEAFREHFAGDLESFRTGFERYALGLKPTVESALIDRHDVLADLFGQLSDKGKTFATVYEFRKTVETMKYRLRYTRGQVSWTAEPAGYFRDGSGTAFGNNELYLEPRKGAALPDLVFQHPAFRIGLRARFYKSGEKMEHEVLIEPAKGATAAIER